MIYDDILTIAKKINPSNVSQNSMNDSGTIEMAILAHKGIISIEEATEIILEHIRRVNK